MTEKSKGLKYKFLIIMSTAYLAVDINLHGFLGLMPFIREEFSLSASRAGLYSTFYFMLATVVAIFSGSIVDRIGSKIGLVAGTLSLGVLMFFHSQAGSFNLILFLAMLSGLAFSILTPSLNKAVMQKVSAENRATSMGIMQMGGGVGGFAGAAVLPFLGEIIGWRNAVLFSAFIALLVGIFIFFFYKDDSLAGAESSQRNNIPFKEAIVQLFKNKNLILVCIFGLVLGFNSGSVPAHYTLYLTGDISVSRSAAGLAFGILQIGGIAGRPLWGYLNDRFLNGSRTGGLIIVGICLTLISAFYSFFMGRFISSLYLIYFSSFFTGFFALGWLGIYFTTVVELASEEFSGIGTGLSLVFVRFGVLISPPLFGFFADKADSYSLSWFVLAAVTLIFTAVFAYIFKDKFAEV